VKSVFLTAEWLNLVMANYEIDPSILTKYIPAKTELDTWHGMYFISLVGFQFFNTRIMGIKIPFHADFEEVNLRFYVRRKIDDDWRRGVVFINEIVPKRAIAFVANSLYDEKYKVAKMRSMIYGRTGLNVRYEWKIKGQWNKIYFHTRSEAGTIGEGSLEEFIAEHYWGYNRVNETKTTEYQVEHPRWRVYHADDYSVGCDFTSVHGKDFSCLNSLAPQSVFMADGSEIKVRRGSII